MQFFKVGFIIIGAALSACAGTGAPKAAGGTAYYYGQVSYLSPDGKLPYNSTDSAVKREMLDGGARLIETVTQPGSGHSMRPKEFVTKLKRRKKTLVYDASDSGGTFTGTLTFKDRRLRSWTYRIKLKDGGAIKGSGRLSPEGIKTEKQLTGTGRPMLIREDLKAVTEQEYEMRVNEMRPPGGAE
ncbi:MAG: hypothetical protein Q7R35_06930 [Elusimicrobiota bacterium]|nr:hypothetical protein [Elusimicrobiota bacterium]